MAGRGRPKGTGGVNKSAKIREFLENNPESTTTEVMECLAQEGIDVSQALVAGVRSRAFGTKRKKKGEITISEIESLNSKINEKFEDRDQILGLVHEFESWCEDLELGDMNRFMDAMKTALKHESVVSSESSEEPSDEYEEDSYDDDDDDDDDDDGDDE